MPSTTRFAGAGASLGTYGNEAWSNAGNITANDTNVAMCQFGGEASGNPTPTNYLRGSAFDFASGGDAVPAGATVDGVDVRVRASVDGGGGLVEFDRVRLVDGDAVVAATDRANDEELTGTLVDYDFGGPTDTWSGVVDADDVRDSDFGAVVAFKWISSPFGISNTEVDSISITVQWTAGDPPEPEPDDAARIRRYRHLDRMRRQPAWF